MNGQSPGTVLRATRDRCGGRPLDTPSVGPQALRARLRHAGRAYESAAVIAIALAIWVLRRPEQLVRPYVWAEESHVIARFVHDGWWGAFQPVQGYEILPVNVLVPLSAALSAAHLPGLMYAFATLVFVGTIAAIVVPESRFGGRGVRTAMAISVALSPANPEVFGVLLYSFWWASLWPVVIIGWKRAHWAWRAPLLVVASLSSPAGGLVLVVFVVSWALRRRRRDLVSALVMLPGAVLETWLTMSSSRSTGVVAELGDIVLQMLRTAGTFLARWLYPDGAVDQTFVATVGAVLLVGLATISVQHARRGADGALLMTVAAAVYLTLSSIPAALQYDPMLGGRYAFLPYATFGWALIFLYASTERAWERTTAVALLVAASLNLAAEFSRAPAARSGVFDWTREILDCQGSPEGEVIRIPIAVDGSPSVVWSLDLTPQECRDLVRGSLTARIG